MNKNKLLYIMLRAHMFRIGSSRLKRIILDIFIRFGSEGTALEMFVEQNSKNDPNRNRLREIS
jgi:hypothetical protein